MQSGIIALFDGGIDGLELNSWTKPSEGRGIDVNETQYLDGTRLYHGTAAGKISTTHEEILIQSDGIFTERVEGVDRVVTNFHADLDAESACPFVAVNSSDGTFLWDRIQAQAGVPLERARIDVDAFIAALPESVSVWQVGYRRGAEDVGVRYHDDAQLDDVLDGGATQIGFEYLWGESTAVRGTLASSGYVAVYTALSDARWARWLQDEVLPHASIPDEEQSQLGSSGGAD